MTQILVTPRSLTAARGDDALEPLKRAGFRLAFGPAGRQPSEDELLDLVRDCSGWLAGVERINARVIDAAGKLRVISRNGTGVEAIDLAAARRRGVAVMTASGANASAVAELAIALMVCGLRRIPESAAAMKRGEWQRHVGSEIGAATIGVIGCGAVGRRVATAAAALGARVLGYDVKPDPTFAPPGFEWVDLESLLATCSIVSLHCPALPGEGPLLDARRLATMPARVGIVNTARASLVDPAALLRSLDDGCIGWYATDVYAEEPPGAIPLVIHPRVLATPHIGALTREGGRSAVRVAVENLLRVLTAVSPRPVGAEAP